MSDVAPSGRLYRGFASLVIVTILGIQFVGGFGFPRAEFWPFLTYPMYAGPRYDGDRFNEYRLFAETEGGERIALLAEDFGYSYWLFRENAQQEVRRGRVPQVLLAQACARHGNIRELVLEDVGYAISRTGPVAGAPEELGRIAVDCGGGAGQ